MEVDIEIAIAIVSGDCRRSTNYYLLGELSLFGYRSLMSSATTLYANTEIVEL